MPQSLTTGRSVSHKIEKGRERGQPAVPPICRVHPPKQLLRSRPRPGFPGSALGSPPTGGGRKVTNYRDRRVAPCDCARSAPTAAVALVSSLAVRIPVQVRPRWEPLPSPEFNTPAGRARLLRLHGPIPQRAAAL